MKSIYAINVIERFAHGMSSIVEVNDAYVTAYTAYAAVNAAPYVAANIAANIAVAYAAAAAVNVANANAYAANNVAAAYITSASAAYNYVPTIKKDQLDYLRSLFI